MKSKKIILEITGNSILIRNTHDASDEELLLAGASLMTRARVSIIFTDVINAIETNDYFDGKLTINTEMVDSIAHLVEVLKPEIYKQIINGIEPINSDTLLYLLDNFFHDSYLNNVSSFKEFINEITYEDVLELADKYLESQLTTC